MNPLIHIAQTYEELSCAAARHVAELTRNILAKQKHAAIALSGGSTPQRMYQILSEQYRANMEWDRILFFWSDERYVPFSHQDNNSRAAMDELLTPLAVKTANIFRVDTTLKPHPAASDYEKTILEHVNCPSAHIPRFDLIFLGIGTDGHTASLFPETDALTEFNKLVTANRVETLNSWRITFTFPLINQANHIIFLATGKEKSRVIRKILLNRDRSLPASHVEPVHGTISWFLDTPAACHIAKI